MTSMGSELASEVEPSLRRWEAGPCPWRQSQDGSADALIEPRRTRRVEWDAVGVHERRPPRTRGRSGDEALRFFVRKEAKKRGTRQLVSRSHDHIRDQGVLDETS